jgi:hypothetical protein
MFVAELQMELNVLAVLMGTIPVIQWRKGCIPHINSQGRSLYGPFSLPYA